MNLSELVGWYQTNISAYDERKREESVEHRIINGIGKYNLKKPTKQKANLIDVDLVRGSSFPKAKRKQSLFTVIRLASLRLIFLPCYSKWWIQQTSPAIYKFFLTLYVFQVFNCFMYIYITSYCEREHIVSMRDIVIPNLLSLLLSFIHSQIVATASTNTSSKPESSSYAKRKKQKQGRAIKRKSNRVNEKALKNATGKNVINLDEPPTNCPNGLRKRNVKWNHIFSPYWVNKNANQLEIVAPIEENFDDTIIGSERSYTDHGFESFNLKSSSSEESPTPSVVSSQGTSHQIHMVDLIQSHGGPTGQCFNLKKNLVTRGTQEGKTNFLSPLTNRKFDNVSTSPWLGITSNSECSYSSVSESDSMLDNSENEQENILPPTNVLKSGGASDKISCTLWLSNKTTKVEMSVNDISSALAKKVENMTCSSDYIYVGLLFSFILALVPVICRICEAALHPATNEFNIENISTILLETASRVTIIKVTFGETISEMLLLSIGLILRFCLIFMLFFMLAVAERTFKQRLLYAKLFSHLTSSRRAKKSEVPHFRLSKLRNIKSWLSVRSYLKKRGPQRSVDVIVSAALILSIVFVSFLCAESLNDSVQQHWKYDLEVFIWSCALGCFILRFMTLGTAINAKYRSVSILITEQINLYLKMEQNPEKKQKLTAANSVLKLAADLLKEIESPFKISGFNINPYLSAAIRVLVVSALSGVCSEMLGFKLKLFKLKET